MKKLISIAVMLAVLGCSGENSEESHIEHPGHKAPHGGALNAIEKCSVGHVEVVLEDDRLTVYFVGGHDNTDKSLPIAVENIELDLKMRDGLEKKLLLEASPLKLAGEEMGKCSRFVVQDDFLKGAKNFIANGNVDINGTKRDITILYPEGFHPDHNENHEE